MKGQDYYTPAAAMAIALAFKLPTLRKNWRDPLLRSVCALLTLAGAIFIFAAPPTITAVNRWTGIPNFSAPFVYCLITAFSAACLVLIVNWRGGPPEETRRVSRAWILGYSAVIVALMLLFVLGDAPVERLRDFDTYYANTPFIRELIALYLVAHNVAAFVMVAMCWRWSLQVRGWLRAGLMIIVVGYLFNLFYDAAKMTAVVGRRPGDDLDGGRPPRGPAHDLDWLSTSVAPPVASIGANISAVGFVLPLVCQRLSDNWQYWSTYRRLGTLWREVRSCGPAGVPGVRMAWWSVAELRMIQRESDIHDGFLHLGPYFDQRQRDDALERALGTGADEETARAVADAAMVAAAVRARAADPEGRVIGASDEGAPPPADGPRDLVRISHALRNSRVVAECRRQSSLSGG